MRNDITIVHTPGPGRNPSVLYVGKGIEYIDCMLVAGISKLAVQGQTANRVLLSKSNYDILIHKLKPIEPNVLDDKESSIFYHTFIGAVKIMPDEGCHDHIIFVVSN